MGRKAGDTAATAGLIVGPGTPGITATPLAVSTAGRGASSEAPAFSGGQSPDQTSSVIARRHFRAYISDRRLIESNHARPSQTHHGTRFGPSRGDADMPGRSPSSGQTGGGGPSFDAPRPHRAAPPRLPGRLHATRRDPLRTMRAACRKGARGAFDSVGRDHRPMRRLCGEPSGSDHPESDTGGLPDLRSEPAPALRLHHG